MITIENLEKSFGQNHVLRGINVEIFAGKVTAIVGPNSAGKSTLIKCILGLVKADKGKITVLGEEASGESGYKRSIGYMPQIARFPDNLKAEEAIEMLKDIRDTERDYDEELIEPLHLRQELAKPLHTLSGGTRQKVSAVISFLFKPPILILDEPTAGLDPVSSGVLKDKIMRERDAGKTVILTSHILSEIEELCDTIVFLLEGKIQYQGSVSSIIEQSGEKNLERAIAKIMRGEFSANTKEKLLG